MGKSFSINKFFGEWKDNDKLFIVHFAYGFMTLFLLYLILVNYRMVPEIVSISNLYILMLLIVPVITLTDFIGERYLKKDLPFVATNKLGNYPSYLTAMIPIVFGVVVGYIIQFAHFTVVAPLAQNASFGGQGLFGLIPWAFLFVVIIAPDVEEQFFRAMITPTMGKILGALKIPFNNIFGLFFSALLFATFHYTVYGAKIELLISAFMFAIIVEIGNHFFKSYGFGLGAHYTNNLLAFIRMG